MTLRRRVVITGLGPVTPVGTGVEDFWTSLREGRSGVGPLSSFDASQLPVRIAGEVDLDESHLDPKQARRMERFSQFAVIGTKLALRDADLDPQDVDPSRVGVVIGTGLGGLKRAEDEHNVMLRHGWRRLHPAVVPMMMANAAPAAIALAFGFQGPNETIATACASSGHAIARSVDLIRLGRADVVVSGGTEALISPLVVGAFCAARVLSTRNAEPELASRPFDSGRDGFVLAEGAAVVILENLQTALSRGAPILAEVLGYGLSEDAYNWTAPHPDGLGAVACITEALDDADVSPTEVDYVNAHATSTRVGDIAEVRALKKIFGDDPPPTSAIKSMTGHLIGAAGATEAAATVLAITRGELPPTINFENDDPECDIDVVPNQARPSSVEVAISNTFGFGGHNACLVLGRHR